MRRTVLALLVLALSLFIATPVLACGGLFCGAPPPMPAPPEPVDQNAEQILFVVEDETITAHVQISYVGPADDFAWVVPVANVPTFAESDADIFDELRGLTALTVRLPAQEPCAFPSSGGGGGNGGCGCSDSEGSTAGAGSDTSGDAGGNASPPVTVFEQDFTDNFEFAIVGADDTQALVTWLQDEDYNVSDNMTPVMDVYNSEEAAFLAVKLRADRESTDIVPVQFTYTGSQPMIPIQLTAVAAQPLMGIQVYIAGDEVYRPANYISTPPNIEEILHDANGVTNYFEWVARENEESADADQGGFFAREYVDVNPIQNRTYGDDGDISVPGQFLSRYYTRMSPHNMALDPIFVADANVPNERGLIDLSGSTTLYQCGSLLNERVPSPCAFNYCGAGAECGVIGTEAGCFCPEDQVAQSVLGPDGTRRVTCVPSLNPVGLTEAAGGAGTEFDPCATVECGAGRCVLKGGFPTCQCDNDAIACVSGELVDCTAVTLNEIETFGPGAGNESRGEVAATPSVGESNETAYAFGYSLPFLTVLGVLLGLRRRRRLEI